MKIAKQEDTHHHLELYLLVVVTFARQVNFHKNLEIQPNVFFAKKDKYNRMKDKHRAMTKKIPKKICVDVPGAITTRAPVSKAFLPVSINSQ